MAPKEVEALKKSFPRQGFVEELEGIEAKGKEFAGQLGAKGAALPSQAFRLITSTDPEAVLWAAHTTKSAALQAKFKSFYTEWPLARQRVPYVMMQEMRITPDLPEYEELVDKLFFELMDAKLGTPEEMKAFLEPYSPPAPPPPVNLRRPRAAKKEAKPAKSRKKAAEPETMPTDAAAEGTGEVRDVEAPAEAATGGVTPPPAPIKAEKAVKSAAPAAPKTAAKAAAPAAAPAKKAVTGGKVEAKKASSTKASASAVTRKAQTKASEPAPRKPADESAGGEEAARKEGRSGEEGGSSEVCESDS